MTAPRGEVLATVGSNRRYPTCRPDQSLGGGGREREREVDKRDGGAGAASLSLDISNQKEATDLGIGGRAWQANQEKERDSKRGQSIADSHPVPGPQD